MRRSPGDALHVAVGYLPMQQYPLVAIPTPPGTFVLVMIGVRGISVPIGTILGLATGYLGGGTERITPG